MDVDRPDDGSSNGAVNEVEFLITETHHGAENVILGSESEHEGELCTGDPTPASGICEWTWRLEDGCIEGDAEPNGTDGELCKGIAWGWPPAEDLDHGPEHGWAVGDVDGVVGGWTVRQDLVGLVVPVFVSCDGVIFIGHGIWFWLSGLVVRRGACTLLKLLWWLTSDESLWCSRVEEMTVFEPLGRTTESCKHSGCAQEDDKEDKTQEKDVYMPHERSRVVFMVWVWCL